MTPKASQRALNVLRGRFGESTFSRVWGCWRYIDIINKTQHNCDDKKLRELIMHDRNLVCREDWIVDGRKFRVFWLNPDHPSKPIGRDIDLHKAPAIAPHDVRLVVKPVEGYAPVKAGSNGRLFEFLVPGVAP